MKSDGKSSVQTHTFIMHTFSDAIHIKYLCEIVWNCCMHNECMRLYRILPFLYACQQRALVHICCLPANCFLTGLLCSSSVRLTLLCHALLPQKFLINWPVSSPAADFDSSDPVRVIVPFEDQMSPQRDAKPPLVNQQCLVYISKPMPN